MLRNQCEGLIRFHNKDDLPVQRNQDFIFFRSIKHEETEMQEKTPPDTIGIGKVFYTLRGLIRINIRTL